MRGACDSIPNALVFILAIPLARPIYAELGGTPFEQSRKHYHVTFFNPNTEVTPSHSLCS